MTEPTSDGCIVHPEWVWGCEACWWAYDELVSYTIEALQECSEEPE